MLQVYLKFIVELLKVADLDLSLRKMLDAQVNVETSFCRLCPNGLVLAVPPASGKGRLHSIRWFLDLYRGFLTLIYLET